tara:strand:- start:66 stop:254 length:189 start_codon:yes stop_codon:yes gene_type:complete
MKKKHYPGKGQKTLCGHEATRQEYEQMIKGHAITCITCQKLLSLHSEGHKERKLVISEIEAV